MYCLDFYAIGIFCNHHIKNSPLASLSLKVNEYIGFLQYTNKGNLPTKEVLLVSNELISLIVAPILVGIAIELFAWWLDKQDDD